ncbi:sterol desaturase family protein [uncultured Parvibaculum sp.]|uniref:sterol desaturase family protein n=1 Tax=uncultured Parvibaculum sp. TaxID=291828 RepID=UPI0030D77044|tara:strand:+ start:106437 stop:107264 length:828 start_codon:yes stop_codon:yes gene_type:complete
MTEFLSIHEPLFRLASFAAVLAAMALWELAAPRRVPALSRWRRWPTNLVLSALGTVLVRLVLPVVAAATAIEASRRGFGLFNWIGTPAAIAVPVSMVALDALIYAQHVVFHRIGLLWRLHRVHHADPDLDVTTGIRFHPVEILISMCVKILAVALLGAPLVAVILFEVLLNAAAMFNHSNVRLPVAADRILRWFIVTPDMHRVHHSVYRDEHDMNFGFSLSVWDRLFGTYRAQPRDGHEAMRIGLDAFPAPAPAGLGWSLLNPFSGATERGEQRI